MIAPMKIALFSDVQANLPAMEEMIDRIEHWNPDLVVMNGDLVNRGPSSLECLDLWRELEQRRRCVAVRGNHEDFVHDCRLNPPPTPAEAELRAFTDWTANQLGERIDECMAWPDQFLFHAPNAPDRWVHVTHGTLKSNRQGILRSTPDEEIAAVMPHGVDLFVTAHTHRPLQRVVDGVTVLNLGSVGSPFDRDPRASYARLVWNGNDWQTSIERFEYDRDRADRDYFDSGFYEGGGPLARLIYEEWRRAEGMINRWRQQYQAAVRAGEISADRAVDEFLAAL